MLPSSSWLDFDSATEAAVATVAVVAAVVVVAKLLVAVAAEVDTKMVELLVEETFL